MEEMRCNLSFSDAQFLFKNFGCSHFHMYREDPELYSNYKDLSISSQQELQWTEESFLELINQLLDDATPKKEQWVIHSRATNLAESIKSKKALQQLLQVSLHMLEHVPERDCIMCAENILERRDISLKGGVIFISIQLLEPALARNFLDLACLFIKKYGSHDLRRSNAAKKRAEVIQSMIQPRL